MPELMTKILENPTLRERFKVAMELVEALDGNPKAMERLSKIIEELMSV
ncbi:MAG: hypothetical protein QXU17_00250 [Archaeoglobaceae archaeon]